MAGGLGDIPVTAEFVAGMRAIAAMDPDEKIRNPDTLAGRLLSPAFWFWTALDEDYDKSKTFIRHYRTSTYYTQNASTKHMDALLKQAAAPTMSRPPCCMASRREMGFMVVSPSYVVPG
jgi:hypothetical protein